MNRLVKMLMITGLALTASSIGHAQATRTWVSGMGDDVNPCSRSAPCKTFPGAISKTAAGGEISVLDPGGFGAVTIVKSITINGDGTLAGILVSGTNGITVNAGATDVVIIRGLSINGAGTGLSGISFLAGAHLVVEDCSITGFTQNGIGVSLSGAANLTVRNTSITGAVAGVRISSGTVNGSLHNVSIKNTATGVDVLSGSTVVSSSVIAQNSSFGVLAEGGSISVVGSVLTGNGTAIQSQTGSVVRVSNNDIFDNATGFGCGGGILPRPQTTAKPAIPEADRPAPPTRP